VGVQIDELRLGEALWRKWYWALMNGEELGGLKYEAGMSSGSDTGDQGQIDLPSNVNVHRVRSVHYK
jgi:hypothetical protein